MSAVGELLRLFEVRPIFPDSTPRISHRQLAKRLGVAPTEIVKQLKGWYGAPLANVLVVDDLLVVDDCSKSPTYWLDELPALLVACEVDTVVGAAVRDEAWWLMIGQSAEALARWRS